MLGIYSTEHAILKTMFGDTLNHLFMTEYLLVAPIMIQNGFDIF